MKKIIEIKLILHYEIEVDTDSDIVKEYRNEDELIEDLASYRFTTLPVINNGVRIKDVEVIEFSKI